MSAWLAALGVRLVPWVVAGAGLSLPVYVGLHPERFGHSRLVSPLPEGLLRAEGFAALRPLIDRSPPGAGDRVPDRAREDGTQVRRFDARPLDSRAVGALGESEDGARPFRVRAVAGGAALVVDGTGAHVVHPGGRLPSGAMLVRAETDGRLVLVARPAARDRSSPAQGATATLAAEGER